MKKLFWLLLVTYAPVVLAASNFTFDVPRGPQPVGFRLVNQYDETRTYKFDPPGPTIARPIQTMIWYPATESAKPMRYRDYVENVVAQTNFKQTPETIRANFDALLKTLPLKKEHIDLELARVMWATRDAPAQAGKFPVVIYAPSIGGPGHENADLCELMASHGYVVISAHASGKDDDGMKPDRAGMELQVADIRFLMKYAEKVPGADASKVVIIGFSWGGIANAFAAVGQPNVRGLVFLDGSMRYYANLEEEGRLNDGKPFTMPIIFFSSGKAPAFKDPNRLPAGDRLLQRMTTGNRYLFKLNKAEHGDFSSMSVRQIPLEAFVAATPAEVSTAYGWVARYTVQFLDAALKNDAKATAFLEKTPADNGVPAGLMSVMALAKP